MPPVVTLKDLFNGGAVALPVDDIERHLTADTSIAEGAVSADQLEEAYVRLASLRPSGAQARAHQHYLQLFQERLLEPPQGVVEDFIIRSLSLTGPAKRAYDGLTPLAREGLYLLLRQGVPRDHLVQFLENPATEIVGGPDTLLRLVALLYDRKVGGFERGFFPTGLDAKFLSPERHRIWSLFNEYDTAFWMADHTDADEVVLSRRLSIDWSELSDRQKEFLSRNVFPHLPEDLRSSYSSQTGVDIDLLVTRPTLGNGRKARLVEVKGSVTGNLSPLSEEEAKILLQVFRHALLVNRHHLEGIEYVIRAGGVSGNLLNRLKEALNVAGVSYLIRIEGGSEKRSISGGLSYEVREGAGSESRSLPLPFPPLPKAGWEEEEEEISSTLPWTREMKLFLSSVIPGRWMNPKPQSLNDFIRGARRHLRLEDQQEAIRRIEQYLKKQKPPRARVVQAIREELNYFQSGQQNRLSTESILRLAKMAALAKGVRWPEVEEEEEPTPAGYTHDDIQYWIINQRWLMGEMGRILDQIRQEIRNTEELFESGELKRADYEQLAQFRMNPDMAFFGSRQGALNLRQMLVVMRETAPEVDWDANFIAEVERTIESYDALLQRINKAMADLPLEEPRRVEDVFGPIPENTLRALRDQVLGMGDLPAPLRKKTGTSSPSASPQRVEFSQGSVNAIYDSLELVHVEGDETKVYYFPEDLARVEGAMRAYLQSAGWSGQKIAEEVPRMTALALQRRGGAIGAIQSLDQLITPEFRRTDLIQATDRFSGAPLDVTKVVKELRLKIPAESVMNYIRVVVMADRRKVYFANWEKLQSDYNDHLWQSPNFSQLQTILSNSERLPSFFRTLWLQEHQEPPDLASTSMVLMGVKGAADRHFSVSGLCLLTEEKAKGYKGRNWFRLTFNWKGGEPFIQKGRGKGAFDLGLSFLQAQLGREITSPVEQALLARFWGTPIQSEDPSTQLTWDKLTAYLGQRETDPILSLWDLLRQANPSLMERPEALVLVGVKIGAAGHSPVTGLRFLTEEEAKGYEKTDWFFLTFNWKEEKPFIQKLGGTGALDLGLSFLQAQLGREVTNPVEQALLASFWGIPIKHEDPSTQLTWDKLIDYLGQRETDPILTLWDLLRQVNPSFVERPEALVLVGMKKAADRNSSVSGLRLLTEEEARGYEKEAWFRLTFNWKEERPFIQKLRGNRAFDLGLSFLQAQLGREITNPVERALLARFWGTPIRSDDFFSQLTWDKLTAYLKQRETDPILTLWNLLRQANPCLLEKPEALVLVGVKSGAAAHSPVNGLRLLTEEEVKGYEKTHWFRLKFNWDGTGYVLCDQPRGTGSAELAEAWQRGRGVDPPAPKAGRHQGGGGLAGTLLLAGALAFAGGQAHAKTVFPPVEITDHPSHSIVYDLEEGEVSGERESDMPPSLRPGLSLSHSPVGRLSVHHPAIGSLRALKALRV